MMNGNSLKRIVYCLLSLLVAMPALACRFNVRDVGFVEFDPSPYYLFAYIDNTTPNEIADQFKQISYAALLDSNIRAEAVNVAQQTDHAALEYLPRQTDRTFPCAVLVSPDGRSMEIPLPASDFKEGLWRVLDTIVDSPMREKIVEQCIQTFGVALMIEGRDKEANARVEKGMIGTITKVKNNMDLLPKAIDLPPQFLKITPASFEEEKILLWSLGIDAANLREPAAAVLYGRGRKIGPLLEGEAAIAMELYNTLAVIGLSCECGLDRSWMMGTRFPFQWNDTTLKRMAKNLGFDPESPMVKTEISQIMAYTGSARRSDAISTTSYSDPLLGYSEITIGADTSDKIESPLSDTPDLGAVIAANQSPTPTPVVQTISEPAVQEDQSTLSLAYLILGCFAVLIAAVGLAVVIRARGKAS